MVIQTFVGTGQTVGGAVMSEGSIDPNYRLVAAADGATVARSCDSAWGVDPPNARWITSDIDVFDSPDFVPPGAYEYEIDLDLTGLVPGQPGLMLVIEAEGDDTLDPEIDGVHAVLITDGPSWLPNLYWLPTETLTPGVVTLQMHTTNGGSIAGLLVTRLELVQY